MVRKGVTLIELLVVLALLSVLAAVVATSPPGASRHPSSGPGRLELARRQAILTGRPTAVEVPDADSSVRALAMPDGRVIGAPASADPLSPRD
jgi:prepilin-type N-terminal cleavage/methylation domain-containing protein